MRQLAVQRASLKGKRLEFRELCHKTGTGGPAAPVRWHPRQLAWCANYPQPPDHLENTGDIQ